MYESYKATKQDLEAIPQAITLLKNKDIDFIFKDKKLLENVIAITYDSEKLYLFTEQLYDLKIIDKGVTYVYEIKHSIQFTDKEQGGWQTGLRNERIKEFIPHNLQGKFISGGLLTPFINIQKTSKLQPNAYTTRESYLATIIHEYGHAYYNAHKTWWYSDKEENLELLKEARTLFVRGESSGKKSKITTKVKLPNTSRLSELYAFCTDYYVSSLFFPDHKEAIDQFFEVYLKELEEKEKKLNLDRENSTLDQDQHNFAAVVGRILIEKFGNKWPDEVLAQTYIK